MGEQTKLFNRKLRKAIEDIDLPKDMLMEQIQAIQQNSHTINKADQGTGKSISAYLNGDGGTVYVGPSHDFIVENILDVFESFDLPADHGHIRGFTNFMEMRAWGDMTEEAKEDAKEMYSRGQKPRIICEILNEEYQEFDVVKEYQRQFPDDWSEQKTAVVRHSTEQVTAEEVDEIVVEENIQDTIKESELSVTSVGLFDHRLREIEDELDDEVVEDIRKCFHTIMEVIDMRIEGARDASESAHIARDYTETHIAVSEVNPSVRTDLFHFVEHLPMLIGNEVGRKNKMEKIITDALKEGDHQKANDASVIYGLLEDMKEIIHYGCYVADHANGRRVMVRRPYLFNLLDYANDHDVDLHFRYAEFDQDIFDAMVERWMDIEKEWRTMYAHHKPSITPFDYELVNIEWDNDRQVKLYRAAAPHAYNSQSITKSDIEEGEPVPNQPAKIRKVLQTVEDTHILFDQVGVIGQMSLETIAGEDKSLHYGDFMGRNDLSDVEMLHVIGRQNLPAKAMAQKHHMIFGTYPEMTDEMYPSLEGYVTKNGSLVGYESKTLDSLYKAQVKRPVRDAINRMRNQYEDRGDRVIIVWGAPIDIIDFNKEFEGSHNRMGTHEQVINHMCKHIFGITKAEWKVAKRIQDYLNNEATNDGRNPRGYDTASVKEYVTGKKDTIRDILNQFFEFEKDGYTKIWSPQ